MRVGDKITFFGKVYEVFEVEPRYILAARENVTIRINDPKEENLQPIKRAPKNYHRPGPTDTSVSKFGPFREQVRMKARSRFRIEWKRAPFAWQMLLQDELAYYGYKKIEERRDGTEIWELQEPETKPVKLFVNEALDI